MSVEHDRYRRLYPWLDDRPIFGGLSWRGWALVGALLLTSPTAMLLHESPEWMKMHGETIIAVATVALAIFTAMLFASTRRLAADAKASGELGLRAYVKFVGLNPRSAQTAAGVEIAITFGVENVGKTPALDVEASSEFVERPLILTGDSDLRVTHPPPGHATRATLMPGDHRRGQASQSVVSTADVTKYRITANNLACYWIVEALYTDVFTNARHHTRQCHRIVWGVDQAGRPVMLSMHLADQFNDAT